jgi:hypothetical protein
VHHRLTDWLDRRRGFSAPVASPSSSSRHSPPKPYASRWRLERKGGFRRRLPLEPAPLGKGNRQAVGSPKEWRHISLGWAFKWARPISAANRPFV